MALSGIYKRLWNPGVSNIIGDSDNVLNGLERPILGGSNDRCFEVYWKGTVEASEIGGAATAVLDGTTTPVSLYVVSISASDVDTAVGHVRKVAIIGLAVKSVIDFLNGIEEPDLYVEVVAMNGTTDVRTTLYFFRLVHMYACHWGSGDDDAAGAITAESPQDTDLLTITAAENESTGGILYFPKGALVSHPWIRTGQHNAPTAALDGADITINYNGFDVTTNDDGDFEDRVITWATGTPNDIIRDFDPVPLLAARDAQVKYTLATITNAIVGTFHALVRC